MEDYKSTIESLRKLTQIKASDTLRSRFENLLIPSIASEGSDIRQPHIYPLGFLSSFSFRIAILVLFLMVLSGSGLVIASDKSNINDPLYPVKKAIERVRIMVTNDPLKKAELHIDNAGNRVEEMKKEVDDNDLEETESLSEEYSKEIEKAVENIQGSDFKRNNSHTNINQNLEKQAEVLLEVKNSVPTQAQNALKKAIEASEKGKEEINQARSKSEEHINQSQNNSNNDNSNENNGKKKEK